MPACRLPRVRARGTLRSKKRPGRHLQSHQPQSPYRQQHPNSATIPPMKPMLLMHRSIPALLAGMRCAIELSRARTYIVDQGAPGTAETNPGTEEKPFRTIQHAADLAQPG